MYLASAGKKIYLARLRHDCVINPVSDATIFPHLWDSLAHLGAIDELPLCGAKHSGINIWWVKPTNLMRECFARTALTLDGDLGSLTPTGGPISHILVVLQQLGSGRSPSPAFRFLASIFADPFERL